MTQNFKKNENEDDETTINQLKSENIALQETITDLEDRSRRNNFRFDGFAEDMNENWNKSEEILQTAIKNEFGIEKDIIIERAHRTGKSERDSGRRRTIVAKFQNYKDKELILEKYREKKLWNDNIYINEDFSEKNDGS